jgi:tryptophan-rich sensory protein
MSMLVARARGDGGQRPLFLLFGTNLALNLAWTLIFFRARSPLAAGVEILVLVRHRAGALPNSRAISAWTLPVRRHFQKAA